MIKQLAKKTPVRNNLKSTFHWWWNKCNAYAWITDQDDRKAIRSLKHEKASGLEEIGDFSRTKKILRI